FLERETAGRRRTDGIAGDGDRDRSHLQLTGLGRRTTLVRRSAGVHFSRTHKDLELRLHCLSESAACVAGSAYQSSLPASRQGIELCFQRVSFQEQRSV